MKPYSDQADLVIDKALTDLVGWARRHGYDPHSDGREFLSPVIDYIAESMDEPEDYDFAEVLHKAQDDGVFDKLQTRDFNKEFPPKEQDYIIAKAGSGRIGLFYGNSYPYYEEKWRQIDRDEVPLDWFVDYAIFTDWDI